MRNPTQLPALSGQGSLALPGETTAPQSAAPDRITRFVLIGHLFLSPLVFSSSTLEAFEFNKVCLLFLAALLLLGLALTGRIRCSAWPRRPWCDFVIDCRDPIALGMLFYLLSAAVSTALSISPLTSVYGAHDSFGGLGTVVCYIVLFFVSRRAVGAFGAARQLQWASIVAAGITASYALFQFLGLDPVSWTTGSNLGNYQRPVGTLGHANHLAAFLVMVFPLAAHEAAQAAGRTGGLARAGAALVALLSVAALVTTLSRGGLMAFAAMLAVLLIGWCFAGRRRAALSLGLLAVLGLGLAGIGLVQAHPEFSRQLAGRLRCWGDSAGRSHVWRASWAIFGDHPVSGCGLDTFALAFGRVRPREYAEKEWGHTPTRAHNEILHTLATQGLLGVGSVLLIGWGIVQAARRSWRAASAAERPLWVALVAGMVGYCVSGIFSFTVVGHGTLFVTWCAFWSRLPSMELAANNQPARLPALGWLRLAFLIALWLALAGSLYHGVVLPQQASRACCRGEHCRAAEDPQALDHFRRAVELDPLRSIYWHRLGVAARDLAGQPALAPSRRQLLEEARQALRQGTKLVPVDPRIRANLAVVLGDLAREGLLSPEAAFVEFDRALAVDPASQQVYDQAAQTALNLGELARGHDYAARGLALYPQETEFLTQLGYVAFRQGKLELAEDYLRKALLGRDRNRGTTISYARATLAAVLLGQGKLEAARRMAVSVLATHPDWTQARFTLAQALERLERREEALAQYGLVLQQCPRNRAALLAFGRLQATKP